MLSRGVSVRLILAAALLGAPLAAAHAIELAAHRALYDLTLASARGDVTGATGTMSYEVGDACDGWTAHQQLAMTITNRDGQDIDMLSDYTTYESKDGSRLRFRSRQSTDSAVTSEVAGDATQSATGGTIRYTQPKPDTQPLPQGALFPMAHTQAIITAAIAGRKFLELPLFDGTGPDGAQDSSVAISTWSGPQASKWPDLAPLPSGRVHVAFFERGNGAQQPEYEVSMRYWENGVADELTMDFGDFVMRGRLKALNLTRKGC
jgi:hypothetical protein